jgi:hypothetical protein
MKFAGIAAACAAATFLWSPIAQAQAAVACADIEQTLIEALDDFTGIEGEDLGDGIYASTLKLPGARDCALQVDFDAFLYCWWSHPDEASARAAYDTLGATVSACLPAWLPEPLLDEVEAPDTAIAYRVFSADDDSAFIDMEILLHWSRVTSEQGVVSYEVWYELAYYLF